MPLKLFQGAFKIVYPKPPQSPVKNLATTSATMSFRAVVFVDSPEKVAIREIPKPKLRDGYVLVKVHAVGINPTDWKSIDKGFADAGARSGCDYSGVVAEVGESLGKPFQKGDRIAGFAHGA